MFVMLVNKSHRINKVTGCALAFCLFFLSALVCAQPAFADGKNDDWHLLLVNKQNPVPEGYEAELVEYNNTGKMVDKRMVADLDRMLKAAGKDGISLSICSAYRSYERQTQLFNNKISSCLGSADNYLKAYSKAATTVAPPGTSEHQTGLALDIVTGSYTSLDAGFGDTKAGKWLAQNGADYGFILRYPKGKEDITGIIYEPWHYRYVGCEYAKEISRLGITLEEYIYGDY